MGTLIWDGDVEIRSILYCIDTSQVLSTTELTLN